MKSTMKHIRLLSVVVLLMILAVIQTAFAIGVSISASAEAVCSDEVSHVLTVAWNVTDADGAVSVTITLTLPDGSTMTETQDVAAGEISFDLPFPGGGEVVTQVSAESSTGSASGSARAHLTPCASGTPDVTAQPGRITVATDSDVYTITPSSRPECLRGACLAFDIAWADSNGTIKGTQEIINWANSFSITTIDEETGESLFFGTCIPLPPGSPGPTFPDPDCPHSPFPFPGPIREPGSEFLMTVQLDNVALTQRIGLENAEQEVQNFLLLASDTIFQEEAPQFSVNVLNGFSRLQDSLSSTDPEELNTAFSTAFPDITSPPRTILNDASAATCAALELACEVLKGRARLIACLALGVWVVVDQI